MGLPVETRVGRVIVEADYHMKMVGIGLEPGTPGVESYLDSMLSLNELTREEADKIVARRAKLLEDELEEAR